MAAVATPLPHALPSSHPLPGDTPGQAKTEKVQEIKKLNAQITQIKSEMSKCEEQLEDCRKYKGFLDMLTPQEWFEEQKKIRLQRKVRCRRTHVLVLC